MIREKERGKDKLVFFATDLHGKTSRYESLAGCILEDPPDLVLLGGDLLPPFYCAGGYVEFISTYLTEIFEILRKDLGERYPEVYLIPGNDDPAAAVDAFLTGEKRGLWKYLHLREARFAGFRFYGYSFIPPTPFVFKDWEKYDVSRYTDPGCIPPDEGKRSVAPGYDPTYSTIADDLESWPPGPDLSRTVILFHSPPYQTSLDRAALDGQTIDHVPLDLHIGSIAIGRFILSRQPYLTLHGHVHESTRLTGEWRQVMGNTLAIQGAGDTDKLVLVRFFLENPSGAERMEI